MEHVPALRSWSSISGDPARWQRYQDFGDGLLFTQGRVLHETPDWNGSFSADNVGWSDQRYTGSYERIGFLKINGLFDEIPQFYSVDTTHRVRRDRRRSSVLDDNAQRAANLNAYLPISPQFDLTESRKIGTFRVSAADDPPRPHRRLHDDEALGELPWGASFGFSNDNEVALPYRSRTNDVDMGLEWSNNKAMFRAGYNGSWFNNEADTLTWDNPLVLTDSTSASGRGRMALWPSNSLQTLSAAGYAEVRASDSAHRLARVGWANNDEPLQPARSTVRCRSSRCRARRPTPRRPPLPRTSAWCRARLTSGGSARGSAGTTTTTTCPRPRFPSSSTTTRRSRSARRAVPSWSHDRNTFEADATWTRFRQAALTVAYTNNHNECDHRIFASTNENILQLKADSTGFGWVNFRARYSVRHTQWFRPG